MYFLFTRKETINHNYLQSDPSSGNRWYDGPMDIVKGEAALSAGLRAGDRTSACPLKLPS